MDVCCEAQRKRNVSDPKEDVDAEEEDAIEQGWETSTKCSMVVELSEVFVDKDMDAGMTDSMIMNGVDISDPRRTFSDVEFQQLGPNGRWHITMVGENDNNSRTVNEIVAWYSHYGPANASPGGYGGNMELPQGLPPLPASVNEANARGGRHGARFGRAAYCG
jgi:hypothetical protein